MFLNLTNERSKYMDMTGAAGESCLDFRRGLRRGFLARFLRMAAHEDLGAEGPFASRGGVRDGPRGEFPFGRFGGRGLGRSKKRRKRGQHGEVRAAVLVLLDEEPRFSLPGPTTARGRRPSTDRANPRAQGGQSH